MYPPEQTQNAATPRSDRRSIVPTRDTELRPVALPALAAAVRGASSIKAAARRTRDTQLSVRFEHEDTPLA